MAILFTLMALSVISLNCNGIRDGSKRAGFVQWLRSLPSSVDVVCLQETHCVSASECQSWFLSSGLSFAVSPGTHKSCGCIMLFRPSLTFVDSWSDSEGRFLQCEFSFRDVRFRVVCVYAPNRNPARDQFFDDVETNIDPSVPTILAGDFNTVFDRSLDRVGSCVADTSRESSVVLARLFESSCCVDIWRYLHPSSSGFTWSRRDGLLSSRIDLVGCPYVWVSSVLECEILPCPFSDHCAVFFSVSVPEVVPPGPGLWKLNISVLEEDGYVQLISDFWSRWRRRKFAFPSLSKWWEEGKSKIKGLTISYCCDRSRANSQSRDLLSRLAAHLKLRVDEGHLSCLGPYHSVLNQLAQFDLQAARGAQIRSRARWVEEGEVSSAYFFRLEKKRSVDRWVSALREPDGSIISSPADLCSSFATFYSELFTSSPTDPAACETLLSHISSTLAPEQAELCEGSLSVDECYKALVGMARRKAPGSDGLPMEFYLKFWSVLGQDLVEVLNFCHRSGSLSVSQRRGIISLVFKKGDRLDARNWRPISLLNVDYKLASRVLAGRLLRVIHLVVHRDQTCGVPGRYIGENVAFLRDVVDYASYSDVPVALLSLDQEKAFDRVDWQFMRATLSAMGFGPSFISWVNLCYTDVLSAVNVNGYLSSFFPLSRGVRQGCPLSPLLYVLVSEVLAVNIRANPRIIGLSLPGVPDPLSPISQYADDTSFVVCSDDSIVAIFETYSLFELGSGAKLNQAKSKGLWLGSWIGRQDPPVPLDWTSVKIKVLGVYLGSGNLEEDNWRPRIVAVENVLASWKHRVLSFRGRALVINALALSRVWYVASLIHVPGWVLSELCRLVFNFFWKGKRELVSRSVVVQPYCSGGFMVVDVKLKVWSLIAQWVRRFASAPSSWCSFFSFWCSSYYDASPLEVFTDPSVFPTRVLPPFYSSLLLAWREVGGSFSDRRASLVFASLSPHHVADVKTMTARSAYLFLLFEHLSEPHCVEKFFPVFGDLYWPATWRGLFLFELDRPVIDLAWKIAHGVLYTADRLVSFGYDVDPHCFCGAVLECPSHLFFSCPLAQSVLSWLQSLMFSFSSSSPSLVCRHALFGFSPAELRTIPRVFVYLLNVCKYFIWLARNDFRFRDIRPGASIVIANVCARVKFHLPLFFKRFKSSRRRRYFHRQWGASGTVGSVVDGVLSLVL